MLLLGMFMEETRIRQSMLATVAMVLQQQPHSPLLLLLQNLEDFGMAIASSISCLLVWFSHLSYHGYSTSICHHRRISSGSFIYNLKLSREQTREMKRKKEKEKTKPFSKIIENTCLEKEPFYKLRR